MSKPDLSIVVPVYNSGDWLATLVDKISQTATVLGKSYEIVLVNDASPKDNTWPVISQICARNPFVIGINLLFNRGQFIATLCGIEHSTGRLVITMDDDLQHPPEELPKLIEAIEAQELDVVFGVFAEVKQNLVRRIGSRLVNHILDIATKRPRGIKSTSLRIMKREIADTLVLYKSARPQISPILFSLTKKVGNTLVEHHERAFGKSNYTAGRLISEAMELIVNGSTIPLDLVGFLGLTSALLGFGLGVYYLLWFLLGHISVPGFTTLVLVVVFFSGVLLLSVAILGKYLTRIIRELTGLPRSVVKEVLNSKRLP